MRTVSKKELRSVEGGKTYYCPFCKRNGITRKFYTWGIGNGWLSYKLHLNTCYYRNR